MAGGAEDSRGAARHAAPVWTLPRHPTMSPRRADGMEPITARRPIPSDRARCAAKISETARAVVSRTSPYAADGPGFLNTRIESDFEPS